jgi:hypothetical protein
MARSSGEALLMVFSSLTGKSVGALFGNIRERRNVKKDSSADCSCSYPGCPRHGKCAECVAYHSRNGEYTACFFTPEGEKLWDRSFECLSKHRRGR